jgi:hypothetical protein
VDNADEQQNIQDLASSVVLTWPCRVRAPTQQTPQGRQEHRQPQEGDRDSASHTLSFCRAEPRRCA